jgi:transposase
LKRDPHAGDLYVFRGKRGHLVKILWHDGIGMSLYAKRLERGRFVWPRRPSLPSRKRGESSRSARRNWPTCSMGSTGATRFAPGGRRWLGQSLPLT